MSILLKKNDKRACEKKTCVKILNACLFLFFTCLKKNSFVYRNFSFKRQAITFKFFDLSKLEFYRSKQFFSKSNVPRVYFHLYVNRNTLDQQTQVVVVTQQINMTNLFLLDLTIAVWPFIPIHIFFYKQLHF